MADLTFLEYLKFKLYSPRNLPKAYQSGPTWVYTRKMKAEFMLPPSGQWVGPPILVLILRLGAKELILDGRKRLSEHARRGLRTKVPRLEVKSHKEAIVALIHAKHHNRAALHAMTYAPEFVQHSTRSLSLLLDMGNAKVLPYVRALKSPAERHKLPRRAMKVVIRARSLYQRAIEGDKIEIEDIEKVLGEFIEE